MKYYYGIIEFGEFLINNDTYPLALVRKVVHVKEFTDPQQAWDFYVQFGCDSYVGEVAEDKQGQRYELAFMEGK
jgi:hypothetical protein